MRTRTQSRIDNPAECPTGVVKGVTIEHIFAKSKKGEQEELASNVEQIGNLTLLEKNLNRDLEDKDFSKKRDTYKKSKFGLTQRVADLDQWTSEDLRKRTRELATLACTAWPL